MDNKNNQRYRKTAIFLRFNSKKKESINLTKELENHHDSALMACGGGGGGGG